MPEWRVQAPDGKVIQFPNEFTDADVNREMSKMYASSTAQQPASTFQVPSPGLQGSQTVQPSGPETSWTEYPKEIAKGIGRGVINTVQGAYQTVRHPIDTAVGLGKQSVAMLDAGAQSAESGEGRAGQTLAMMENAPIVGGAVRYAESGGTKTFNPKSVGAAAELGTYYGAPKVAEGIGKGVIQRGGAAVDVFKAKSVLNDAIANAEGMGRQAKTLNVIDKGAQAIFNRAKSSVQLLQGKLKSDAQAAIQPAIEADKAAGQKPLMPIQAALDAHKAMESTGYVPTRVEQALLDTLAESPEDSIAKKLGYPNSEAARADVGANVFNDFVQKGAGGTQAGGLTLDKALQLRTAIGSAAAKARRGGNAKANMVLTNAYEGMNDSINGRLNELEGKAGATDSSGKPASNKAFEQYNKNHKAAFELEQGFTGNLLDNVLDHHEARGKLSDFVGANLTQVTKQMRDKGLDPRELMQLQSDAQKTIAAHDSIMGKFNKSLTRQIISGTPGEAVLPMSLVMMMKGGGLYGMVPYMAATVLGKVVGNAGRMIDYAKVLKKLDISDKVLNTRTQPGPLETVPFPSKPPESNTPEANPTQAKAEAIKKAKARR